MSSALVDTAQARWNEAATEAQLNHVRVLLLQAVEESDSGNTEIQRLVYDRLLLLLAQSKCQAEREDAYAQMHARGYKYRLSSEVLLFNSSRPDQPHRLQDPSQHHPCAKAFVADSALPQPLYHRLTRVFARDAPFWSEHRYASQDTGYFSYMEPLGRLGLPVEGGADADVPKGAAEGGEGSQMPCTLISEFICHLQRLVVSKFPLAKRARVAEWWAQYKPHAAGT
jgi:hypothetical protein